MHVGVRDLLNCYQQFPIEQKIQSVSAIPDHLKMLLAFFFIKVFSLNIWIPHISLHAGYYILAC